MIRNQWVRRSIVNGYSPISSAAAGMGMSVTGGQNGLWQADRRAPMNLSVCAASQNRDGDPVKKRRRKRTGLMAAYQPKLKPPKPSVSPGDASEIRMVIDILRDTFRNVGFARPTDWERDFLERTYWYVREWTRTGQAKATTKNLRIMFGLRHRDLAVALMIASSAPMSHTQLRSRSRALRYAYSTNVGPKDFLSFVDRAGGVGACARRFKCPSRAG